MRLDGERVSLCPMRPEELKLIHKWINLPEILPFWDGRARSLQGDRADYTADYFTDDDPHTGRCFAIGKDITPIGMICREDAYIDGKLVDTVVLSILRREFESI